MKRTTKYVALDVHQATTVASVREESGRVIARAIVPTEEAALLKFFSCLRRSVHVAFEEGTQAQWLRDLLSPRVQRVLVCDRRGEKKHGIKGDDVDADQLSNDLLRGALGIGPVPVAEPRRELADPLRPLAVRGVGGAPGSNHR